MDAQVANVLLVGGDTALAADRSQDLGLYASDRSAADADLQQAAELPQPTGPDRPPGTAASSLAEQRELRSVLDDAGQYEALVADAILADQQSARAAGHAPAAALAYYRQATDLMQTGILPQVSSLIGNNATRLDSADQAGLSQSTAGIAITAALGLALIGTLAAFQVYLAIRFRRMVNPALAAATLLVIAVTGFACGTFSSETGQLRVAKHDAFDSIIALSQARAVSHAANADESRYLIDPGRAAQYQQAFLADSEQLAAVGTATIASYGTALDRDIAAYQASSGGQPPVFGGYLGAEFRNFTFPGERQAAVRALLAYQGYETADRHLRALAASNVSEAVAFDIGTSPGQSDWAFNRYATALSSVIAVNADGFTTAIAAGERAAGRDGGLPVPGPLRGAVIPAVALLLAGLAFLGVRPRLAEYHAEA
jgi:hypothetical protein